MTVETVGPIQICAHRKNSTNRAEFVAALTLTLVVLSLACVRLWKAGALWRDEAGTFQLATMPDWKDVLAFWPHEAFPPLFPVVIRVWVALTRNSDTALRLFGFLVTLGVVGVLWWSTLGQRRGFPLISLSLLGLNATFLEWTGSVRGYGLGMLFILLTSGLVLRVVEAPSKMVIAATFACSVCSVQVLLSNAVLLFAICISGAALSLWQRRFARAGLVLSIGLAAAISLLPYGGQLSEARSWDILVRGPVSLVILLSQLSAALGASVSWHAWLWLALFLVSLFSVSWAVLARERIANRALRTGLAGHAALQLLCSLVAILIFFEVLQYSTQSWYYLGLMAVAALSFDWIASAFSEIHWAHIGRVAFAIAIAAFSIPNAWKAVNLRQTNIDLIAETLKSAPKKDLIIVTPWYYGITFSRYYRWEAEWLTIPPLNFHQFHRYDLIKPFLEMPDQKEPIRPVLERAIEVLKGGGRVWVIGKLRFPSPGIALPTLTPAPDPQMGWTEEAYDFVWTCNLAAYLQAHARVETVEQETKQAVERLESPPLTKFEGWSEL
jgi:hypothetical protein